MGPGEGRFRVACPNGRIIVRLLRGSAALLGGLSLRSRTAWHPPASGRAAAHLRQLKRPRREWQKWNTKNELPQLPDLCGIGTRIHPTHGEILMLTSSRYLMNGSPIHCRFCGEPFRRRDGFVEFWRTATGDHFCSEFCADDAEEALFKQRHTTLPVELPCL